MPDAIIKNCGNEPATAVAEHVIAMLEATVNESVILHDELVSTILFNARGLEDTHIALGTDLKGEAADLYRIWFRLDLNEDKKTARVCVTDMESLASLYGAGLRVAEYLTEQGFDVKVFTIREWERIANGGHLATVNKNTLQYEARI